MVVKSGNGVNAGWALSDNFQLSKFGNQIDGISSLDCFRFTTHSPSANMPKATSGRFSRGHDPSVRSAAKKSGRKQSKESSEPSSSGTRNPIFNTERFGQHILKNPLVAQG